MEVIKDNNQLFIKVKCDLAIKHGTEVFKDNNQFYIKVKCDLAIKHRTEVFKDNIQFYIKVKCDLAEHTPMQLTAAIGNQVYSQTTFKKWCGYTRLGHWCTNGNG